MFRLDVGSGSWGQVDDADEVVLSGGEGEVPAQFSVSLVPCSTQVGGGLKPSEEAFHPFPLLLAFDIIGSIVERGIDQAGPPAFVTRHMRVDAHSLHPVHEIAFMISLVRSHDARLDPLF